MKHILLHLKNETHTLGNVICKHASLIYSFDEMSYVGYKNPHPLKKFIQIDITPQPFTFENHISNTVSDRIKDIVSTSKSLKKIRFEGLVMKPNSF